MDKRKNKILVGCLALLLAMTVGYALFSETITINGTATAKGDFDITATCTKGWDSRFGSLEDLGASPEGGYKNDTCVVNDNEVSINVDLQYPGAIRYFVVKMTNTGTIDATINTNHTSGGDITITGKVCLNLEEDAEEINEATDCSDDLRDPFARALAILSEPDLFAFEKDDGTLINMLTGDENADYSDFFNSDTNILTLKPGESGYWVMAGVVNEDLGSSSGGRFLMKTDLTIDFNWNQRVN